ncbi:MAG: hypothetical protein OHK93_004518 [Ramalina farinacea]|uniref:Oxidoreductase AflY n=1 Tax=Ramalina farinacea TaxID=258253 RepID=A0AA43TV45_9LECA|nr:hypothetical protein [Ramalina farinacea]
MAAVNSPIRLSPAHLGVFKAGEIAPNVLEKCNGLLKKNHEAYHIFFRDPGMHNHMVHSLLTCLTLGANAQDLQDRYNDLAPSQRAIPEIDEALIARLDDAEVFYSTIGQVHQYHTFLEFFKGQIAAVGYQKVILEYVFSHSKVAERMLVQMVEGAYHPIIHIGFGVEFDQPAIVAEGLALAASQLRMKIEDVLFAAEMKAAAAGVSGGKPKPLIELIHDVRASERIRTAPVWSDLAAKITGVVERAGDEMARMAAEFRIKVDDEDDLNRRTAEMISACTYLCGAAHQQGRPRKIDFFLMHCVTSSIFCTVLNRQDWIPLADRARLVEYKARTDLMWYAATGSALLDTKAISGYKDPESNDLSWDDLFRDVVREGDDGHAAKFIRAVKNGEQTSKIYEQTEEWADYFPCKGDMWLKVARLCQDTTKSRPTELKWVFFTGFEEGWKRPDLADPLSRFQEPTNGF